MLCSLGVVLLSIYVHFSESKISPFHSSLLLVKVMQFMLKGLAVLIGWLLMQVCAFKCFKLTSFWLLVESNV